MRRGSVTIFMVFEGEKCDSPSGKFRYDFWRWYLITSIWRNVICWWALDLSCSTGCLRSKVLWTRRTYMSVPYIDEAHYSEICKFVPDFECRHIQHLLSLKFFIIRWRGRTNKMQHIRYLLSNFLSQHVSGIIMPIIRRISLCPTACGVLPGCVGCGWLWSCWAESWAVCTVWKLLFDSHSAHSSRRSSIRPQPTTAYTPRQNTACNGARSCSPDAAHNDVRNMLRQKVW